MKADGQASILVTGASGLIGRHTAYLLADQGCRVTVVGRNSRGLRIVRRTRPELIEKVGDLRNPSFVAKIIQKQDAVIHLAGESSLLSYEKRPVEAVGNTIEPFLNILEAARCHGPSKIVYASTSAVHRGNSLPYREDMVVSPGDLRAIAKRSCEDFGALYSGMYGLSTIGVRPFSVYGDFEWPKGVHANVVSLFVWAMLEGERPMLWGDGTQRRDFIHADDVAAVLAGCALEDVDAGIVNAGTGVETSFNEIIAMINKELGSNLEPESVGAWPVGYPERVRADVALQEQLGVLPSTSIEEGISRVIRSSRSRRKEKRQRLAKAQGGGRRPSCRCIMLDRWQPCGRERPDLAALVLVGMRLGKEERRDTRPSRKGPE